MNSFQPKDDSTPHIIAPDVRGAWVGLSLVVTKADAIHTLLERVACSFRLALNANDESRRASLRAHLLGE